MGDRVLFIVTGSDGEVSPTAYGHWAGEDAVNIIDNTFSQMEKRKGDVSYFFARLMQNLITDNDSTGFGAWNTPIDIQEHIKNNVLNVLKDYHHGDEGLYLIDCDNFTYKQFN